MNSSLDADLMKLIYHELGIVPMDFFTVATPISEILSSLPPDEARKMKRKFRKLWRKAVTKPKRTKNLSKTFATRYKVQSGYGSRAPTVQNKWQRQSAVMREVRVALEELKKKMKSSM